VEIWRGIINLNNKHNIKFVSLVDLAEETKRAE
jgi:hypothetical protein